MLTDTGRSNMAAYGAIPHRVSAGRDDVCDLDIQRKVSALWDVTISDMRSPSQGRRVSQARCALIYALRCFTDLTTCEIALFLGRDKATISHGTARALSLAKANSPFRERFKTLCVFCETWGR